MRRRRQVVRLRRRARSHQDFQPHGPLRTRAVHATCVLQVSGVGPPVHREPRQEAQVLTADRFRSEPMETVNVALCLYRYVGLTSRAQPATELKRYLHSNQLLFDVQMWFDDSHARVGC